MAKNLLQQHFPMIQDRTQIREEIRSSPVLSGVFDTWNEAQQKEFLDFCTGERGVKILYDSFFKEIFNPEYAPQRLEEFLSLILGQPVRILSVLPNDTTRIADENSLLITDIVVELKDCGIANVEVQKIGYMFPGQRSACYSADMLLRQYKRIRRELKKKFSYSHIRNVYTVVLYEHSAKEFLRYREHYLHHYRQRSDTGPELELLQEYYFVSLDIFRDHIHNEGIRTKLDAWLTFLTVDDPETILLLTEKFPEFKTLYEEIYGLCRNVEGVMRMFSKELQELDRNTVQYMIDVMQDEIDDSKRQLAEYIQQLQEQIGQLEEQDRQLEEQGRQLAEQGQQLEEKDSRLRQQELEQQLYEKLVREGRQDELMRAVSDAALRLDLLEKEVIMTGNPMQ